MTLTIFRNTFFFFALCQFAAYVVSESAPPSSEDVEPAPSSSPSTPYFGKKPNPGPYDDLPKIFTFRHDIDWKQDQTEVYDTDGNVAFLISGKANGTSIGKDFVINSPKGEELLRVAMHVVQCLVPQTYPATHGIEYRYDTRAALPDKIHIHSDTSMKEGLKHKDYVYHRLANSDSGSVKIGESSTDRVAKVFQSKPEDGWQKEKIGHKTDVTIIRSNDEIPGQILIGMTIISAKVIHKCGY